MSEPYIGQLLLFAGNFAPYGYQACDGSLLSIAQYDALFNLIGTTYGGDGQTNFAVPDLRGRLPVSAGTGPKLSPYALGQSGGAEQVTLTTAQLPVHTHPMAVSGGGSVSTPGPTTILAGQGGQSTVKVYGPYDGAGQTALAGSSIGSAGNGQPHDNRPPCLAITVCIATQGVYPSKA